MNSDILVDSGSIAGQLSAFKAEMGSLDALLSKIETETANAKSFWEGDASDATLSEIDKFSQVFDTIKEQNQVYVDFLNEVVEKYTDEDDFRQISVNSNTDAFDTNI